MFQVDSLLSARKFLSPQYVENKVYCVSDLGGRLSLFRMEYGGSVPIPLLPNRLALQNPMLIDGYLYGVLPKLGKILVMLDCDGNEAYQPMLIPIGGGYPQPAFPHAFDPQDTITCPLCDVENNIVYLNRSYHQEQMFTAYYANLETGKLEPLGSSQWGCTPVAYSPDHRLVILEDGYGEGDNVLYLVDRQDGNKKSLLIGKPLQERKPGEAAAPSNIFDVHFLDDGENLLFISSIFDDRFSPTLVQLSKPGEFFPVTVHGIRHTGAGEMSGLKHLSKNHFALEYNIDGCSWLYTAKWDARKRQLTVDGLAAGEGELSEGVIQSYQYQKEGRCFTLSFSSAVSPSQLYTIEGEDYEHILRHTDEQLLGITADQLSRGEDASFQSFDGLRVSARLYMPSPALNYEGKRPLVYYIHGGPNDQERPDFAWFSMPLIQLLTLHGFAVFVPNVRGSTGYGTRYARMVNRDWGGKDRQDHVYAMTHILPQDERLDTGRAGVVGRSYGGYMSLTLACRHPSLWKAAVDLFGPYDLISFSERVPETWKPYFRKTIGNPADEADRRFLIERSPSTYLDQLACPLLVIQGKNDRRVVEGESSALVESLRAKGKTVEYLLFEDEGHDILKRENLSRCYNEILQFFKVNLHP